MSVCERVGAEGREAVSCAGIQVGRACVEGGHAETVEDALKMLGEMGVAYRVDGCCIVARLAAFDATGRVTPEIVSHLPAGLILGALDGTGLSFTVRPYGPVELWTFVLAPVTADSDGVSRAGIIVETKTNG
jgi:hypothetical protein